MIGLHLRLPSLAGKLGGNVGTFLLPSPLQLGKGQLTGHLTSIPLSCQLIALSTFGRAFAASSEQLM